MGFHVVKMPDIGEGIAEVELVAWHVKEGDSVTADQALADVMTDKAAVEIPSPVNGKVVSLGGKIGEVMAVGSELIRLEVEGAGNIAEGASEKPAAKAPASAPKPALAPVAAAPAPKPAPAPPPPAKVAAAAPAPRRAASEKPIASPAVRRQAWDLGVDLRFVQGTGPAGRVMHDDVVAYAGNNGASGEMRADTRYAQRDDEEQVQVIGLRRKIAEKMQEAKRRIPHFAYVEEVDVTELEALRVKLNDSKRPGQPKLAILPFLMRAMVLALRGFPQINARFDDDAGVVTRYGAVHLGIATQTKGGLVVPVVRHAEARDIWACAEEVTRLANAARDGKATREELSGSTITITSLGALGGIATTPVINHPEVAIVGVNKMVERPVIQRGAIVPRKLMNLSSSFDHRVVDGYDAAEFIQKVRGYLETPATLFVE